MITDKIISVPTFYIYGAQVVAYGAYVAIRHLTGKIPKAFIVSTPEDNPTNIEGIIVTTPDCLPRDAFIVVAVTELLQREVVRYLEGLGFETFFSLTQHEEYLLMSAYFRSLGKFLLVEEGSGKESMDLVIYEVRNHRDKPLEKRPSLQWYEHTIQAGAALTKERFASILDNTGDNISKKNKQYCEMTATYWAWKNTKHEWTGIEHYRRHLLVTPAILADDVDAILPLPYICYPDEMAQFRRFVGPDVVEALRCALKTLHPDEYAKYDAILNGPYQYTYNLLCARRKVFEEYCAWFFRITEYMETMADEVSAIAETRALSYVAEVLTNLYFMSHNTKWNIRHAEKAIYV